jgi:uncharacterized membrane protein (DUF441 family)
MQTKLDSFIETLCNTGIGFGIGLWAQALVFPIYNINVPMETNVNICIWFTVISIVGGCLVRRYFNARIKSFAHTFAEFFSK